MAPNEYRDDAEIDLSSSNAEPLVFLRGQRAGVPDEHAGKTLRQHADGSLSKLSDYSAGALAAVVGTKADDATSFFDAIQWAASQPGLYWVRGRLTAAGEASARQVGVIRRKKIESLDKRLPGAHERDPACLEEFPRRGHMIDVDSAVGDDLRAAGIDIYKDPDAAARLVAGFLPEWVRRGPLAWSLSGSSGVNGAHDARLHFFFWTDLPISAEHLKALLRLHNDTRPDICDKNGKPALLDVSVLHAVQPHYVAAPRFYDEGGKLASDPLPKRWGRIAGELPHSPLPMVDLLAAGSARAESARVHRRVTGQTMVKIYGGETTRLADLTRRTALPKSSAGCERLIGDGLRGFHEPTRDAIFWRLVELLEAGSADALADIEPYLGHLQRLIDTAPKGGRDLQTIAARRDLAELRRMAIEGLSRAEAVAARRRARRASVAPLFPDSELPLADAQADLEAHLASFFSDARAYHDYEEGYRARCQWWREHRGTETRGWFNFLRINTRFAAPPIYIAAHETGLAKSSGTQRQLAGVDLSKYRVFYFAPNHAACDQVRADLAAKHGIEAFVLKGIDYVDKDGNPVCEADQQLKDFAERGKLAQASQRETACTICPWRAKCAYLRQADEMRRPGVKILPHAFLQATIPGLTGKDAAPIFCVVLDEKFTDSLKVALRTSWGERERGATLADKWARHFLERRADTPGQWSTDDHALRKLAERALEAADEYNAARGAARDDLRTDIKTNGLDADFGYASLARRQHLKFIAKLSQLVNDQLRLRRERLQGVRAEWRTGKDGERRLHADICFRDLLPDFGCPVLALDATHDDVLTDAIFAERRYIDCGDGRGFLAEPIAPFFAPKFRRVRAKKPNERIVIVPDVPSAKGTLGTKELIPTPYQRVSKKLRQSGAAVVARNDGKFDVFPARQRRDSHFEQVSRALRWFTESARHDPSKQSYSAGIFGHKEARAYWEAHGMLGSNVRPGHHGIGTALNDWREVERFAVVGVTRLDDDKFGWEVESYFTLAPSPDTPRMTKRPTEAGLRLRDRSGYPVRRWVWDEERVDALYRQIGEAQLEQELGRARSVWRSESNPVTVLVMANAVIDRTFDAVLTWEQLTRLTPFDVAASAGVMPHKAHELDKLLPGLFSSPRAAKDEVCDLHQAAEKQADPANPKNDARGYIEELYIGAGVVFGVHGLAPLAGLLPTEMCRKHLAAHDVTMKRGKHTDCARVLADANKPEALDRYAAALGKRLKSSIPAPALTPQSPPWPAAPHCSPEHGALVDWVPRAAKERGFIYVWELPNPNSPPWPELPAPPLCA